MQRRVFVISLGPQIFIGISLLARAGAGSVQTNRKDIASSIVGAHLTGDIEKFASTADFGFF